VPLPSRGREPLVRRPYRRLRRFPTWRRRRRREFPPLEPPRGRARVEALRVTNVLLPVGEHVNKSVPHFTRRSKRASVVAIRPHLPPPIERAVDRERHANRKSSHPFREVELVLRLDHQVNVVALYREVQDPEPAS